MTHAAARTEIERTGIIPSIRTGSAPDALFAAEAISEASIPIIEITMTIPGAVDIIAELVTHLPDVVVGAGTVFDLDAARRCLEAGAAFLTSPGFDPTLVEYARQQHVLAIPGAVTPTEIMAAWRAGADFIKVFPCAHVGGAAYIRALKAPFPRIPLIAAGGITQQTAGEFIAAGALAIGVGRELIPRQAVEQRQKDWIVELAGRFADVVQHARARTEPAHLPDRHRGGP
jgi:2-dehydro-3-deoxyphosphogluconate aldolase / (4S)-4-hydroxy-2-oxoglutarate aldolase